MRDRARNGAAPPGRGGGEDRGDAPLRAGPRGPVAAYLDLWDRNLSELARHGPAALGPRAMAARKAAEDARRRAEAGRREAGAPGAPRAPSDAAARAAAGTAPDTEADTEAHAAAHTAPGAAPDPLVRIMDEARAAMDRILEGGPAADPDTDAAARAAARARPSAASAADAADARAAAEAAGAAPHRIGAPAPLAFHLGGAAVSISQAAAMGVLADDPRFPWTEAHAERGAALGAALREAEGMNTGLAIAAEGRRQLAEMIEGIERWQRHPWSRAAAGLETPPTVWRRGAARLIDYGATHPAGAGGPPVIVVPSLVNRAYVLDLHPERSLLRWLAAQGLRPLLLDWGDPGYEERDFDLSDYVRLRLAPAVEGARFLSPDGAAPAVLGYCMGGALAAALAAGGRDRISRLAAIGAPWDFDGLSAAARAMLHMARMDDRTAMRARLEATGAAFGAIPVDALQLVFAALDPTLAFRKFRAFRALHRDGTRAELFAATEDWLNDGVALAQPAARELLFSWFLDNALERGVWAPEGEPVRPGAVRAPVLAFCSSGDRIAPPACAEPLAAACPGAKILRPATGHVGMIMGREAPRTVWAPLAAFLKGG